MRKVCQLKYIKNFVDQPFFLFLEEVGAKGLKSKFHVGLSASEFSCYVNLFTAFLNYIEVSLPLSIKCVGGLFV